MEANEMIQGRQTGDLGEALKSDGMEALKMIQGPQTKMQLSAPRWGFGKNEHHHVSPQGILHKIDITYVYHKMSLEVLRKNKVF